MKPDCLPEKIVWSELDQEQRGALLEWAKNEIANLSDADLSRANLSMANLSDADLSEAKNIPENY